MSEAGECPAKSNTGQRRFHFACGTSNLGGGRQLGIERLELAGPAMQKQKDDGAILRQRSGRCRSSCDQTRQSKPSQRQAADTQKITSPIAAWRIVNRQHADGLPELSSFVASP